MNIRDIALKRIGKMKKIAADRNYRMLKEAAPSPSRRRPQGFNYGTQTGARTNAMTPGSDWQEKDRTALRGAAELVRTNAKALSDSLGKYEGHDRIKAFLSTLNQAIDQWSNTLESGNKYVTFVQGL